MSQSDKFAGGNRITIRPNGPLVCEGNFTLLSSDGEVLSTESELYLCRCGASKTMPFCDGSHKKIEFEEAVEFEDARAEELEDPTAPVTITCRSNAMYLIKGPVTIQSRDGRFVTTRNRGALCRCGVSEKKPFCDASHKQCGFQAD